MTMHGDTDFSNLVNLCPVKNFSLIWTPVTHMHGLAVYVKEGLPFARDLSLEKSVDSYLCFGLALLDSVSHFLFLYQSPSLSLCSSRT